MTDVPLLTHIEALLDSYERRRVDLREADRRWLETRFEASEKALKLEASSYPTTENFNELTLFVREEFAKLQGRTSLRDSFWRSLSVLSFVVAVIVAIFTYYAPAR